MKNLKELIGKEKADFYKTYYQNGFSLRIFYALDWYILIDKDSMLVETNIENFEEQKKFEAWAGDSVKNFIENENDKFTLIEN